MTTEILKPPAVVISYLYLYFTETLKRFVEWVSSFNEVLGVLSETASHLMAIVILIYAILKTYKVHKEIKEKKKEKKQNE